MSTVNYKSNRLEGWLAFKSVFVSVPILWKQAALASFWGNTGGLKCTCWISFRVIHRVSGRAGNMDKPISGSKFSEEFCTEAWPIIWNHYIWYSMSYIKLFGYCDNALCSLGFKLLVFNPLRVLINSGEACSSPILKQIYAYSLPRTTGEGGRHQGFLKFW